MSSFRELMTDVAETHREAGDNRAHDAVLAAISDPDDAKKSFPDQVKTIKSAQDYANREMRNSGHN